MSFDQKQELGMRAINKMAGSRQFFLFFYWRLLEIVIINQHSQANPRGSAYLDWSFGLFLVYSELEFPQDKASQHETSLIYHISL